MAEQTSSAATVQLVRGPDDAARRTSRLGLGLLVSLIVGWPALSTALSDPDAFEGSILRFLVTVALSVAAVLSLGWLYDHLAGGTGPRPANPAPSPHDPTLQEEHR